MSPPFAIKTPSHGRRAKMIGLGAAICLLLTLLFPPWLMSAHSGGWNIDTSVGYGTFFSAPGGSGTAPGYYLHIDYGRVLFQILIIVLIAGIALIISALKKPNGVSAPTRVIEEDLMTSVQMSSRKAIVAGYRRVAAKRGCAPTNKTTDGEILALYAKVGKAFKGAADKRDELLSTLHLNTIVLFFLQQKESFGDDMADDHLQYEVEKYLSEGLRPDYKQELRLF